MDFLSLPKNLIIPSLLAAVHHLNASHTIQNHPPNRPDAVNRDMNYDAGIIATNPCQGTAQAEGGFMVGLEAPRLRLDPQRQRL